MRGVYPTLEGATKEDAEHYFPELCESEDERIRKDIVFYIAAHHKDDGEKARWLYWLEKQGKHANFCNKIQIGDKVTRNKDGVLVNLSQLKRIVKPAENKGKNNMGISEATKKKLEDNLNKALEKETPESCNEFLKKQGEQKAKYHNVCDKCVRQPTCQSDCFLQQEEQMPAENKGMNLVEEEMTPFQKKVFCIIDTTIEEEQGLKQVCDELLRLAHDEIMQTPTAWSEEDEKIYQSIMDDAVQENQLDGKQTGWLRNIKYRNFAQPQNTWKPSERQIQSIRNCVLNKNIDADTRLVLDALYADLKKLKG